MIKAKKLIILFCVIGFLSAAAYPVYMMVNKFTSTSVKDSSKSRSSESEVDKEIQSANQGFESVDVLGLTSNLGEVEEISEATLTDLIYQKNSQLGDKNIYIKAITLRKVKFTVEDYTGTFDAEIKVTNLGKIIENAKLGKIKNVRPESIISKIKEKNPTLASINLDNDLVFDITGLNEISMNWSDESLQVTQAPILLSFECISLDGLFWNTDIGVTTDVTESSLSKRVANLNEHLKFLTTSAYSLKLESVFDQTPSNAKMYLALDSEKIAFENVSTINVTYNVSSIETLVKNTDLGEIENVSTGVILAKLVELNPILQNYSNLSKITISNIGTTYATAQSSILSGRLNLKFSVKNVNDLLLTTDIGTLEYYPADATERKEIYRDKILASNQILKDLNVETFVFANSRVNTFLPTDEVITGNQVTFSMSGFDGSVAITFEIQRKKVADVITNTNLGKIYWVRKEDIIAKIKDANGSDFDESELEYSDPTFNLMKIVAKDTSINYYGEVEITFETLFVKTNNYNLIQSNENAEVSTDAVSAGQDVYTSTQSSNKATWKLIYEVPGGNVNEVSSSFKDVNLTLTMETTRLTTFKAISGNDLKEQTKTITLKNHINELSDVDETYELIAETSFEVPFTTRNWLGTTCFDFGASWMYSSKLYYKVTRQTVDGIDSFVYEFGVSSGTSDWSSCDNLIANVLVSYEKLYFT